ncbi:MAG: hypothetical protein V7K16_03090 [Nostoc sp.]
MRSGFNYQLHRHILNKTRFISLRSHPEIPISVLGFSTSQNRIAPSPTSLRSWGSCYSGMI